MSRRNATGNARASHSIHSLDVAQVLCHRLRNGREEYLIRWQSEAKVALRAICSWHSLDDLSRALHYVQRYVEAWKRSNSTSKASATTNGFANSRKRKSPGDDNILGSRDSASESLGVSSASASPSLLQVDHRSTKSGKQSINGPISEPLVYNGVLEKKEGRILASRSNGAEVAKINAASLPTPQMLEEARNSPVKQGEHAIREAFYKKLRPLYDLSLENNVDSSTPSLDFRFINDYVLGSEVYRADAETFEGCQKPCKPNMGQHVGCEYPRLCSCLEYAAVHESILEKEEPQRYLQYMRQKQNGEYIDKKNLPKRFPYHKAKGDHVPQTLQPFYRHSRHPIYECNINCNCSAVCKSRVVQKGRKVPLTIFKTPTRGWGVYCREDLIQGEFIDTYLGEIITNEETDRRELLSGKDKASYLYSLDKFVGEGPDLTMDNCYVVDGQYMGGPTRFINHSCEPNCRQYTVSYNKHDPRVYDLAFFAIEDIPAGTELTFDYMDKDEEEEDDVIRKRKEAAHDPSNHDKIPCNCGARKCRGYLWV